MPRSPLVPIFLTVFVDVLGMTLMLPQLPFYAEHFGATPLMATSLMASYALAQLFASPILGRMSDRVGRKPVLLLSQVGTLIAFLTIGSANSLAMLFVGRVIDGLTAGNLSIAQAYISDVTKPEDRTRSFALIGIAFGSGFLFGPAISGELTHRFGFAAPAFLAAALSALSITLSATLLPGRAELEKIKHAMGNGSSAGPMGERTLALGRFFSRPLPRRRLLQFFAFTTSFATLNGGLALFLEHEPALRFSPRGVGWVYGVSGLIGGLIQGGAIRHLVKRFGEARLAMLGFCSMFLAYPLLGTTGLFHGITPILVLLGLVAFASFGVAVVRPCLTTLITKSVGREEQGAALGTSQSLASIAQIIGPETAGILIQGGMLWAYGVAAGVSALVGAVLSLQPDPETEGKIADPA